MLRFAAEGEDLHLPSSSCLSLVQNHCTAGAIQTMRPWTSAGGIPIHLRLAATRESFPSPLTTTETRSMLLRLTRIDERRYETEITHSDGVTYHVKGVGHMSAIPHDLAHFAIEQGLRIRGGF